MTNATSGKSLSSAWLRLPPIRNGHTTLFCLPYSGAGASMYSSWVNNIPSVTVCPVEFPGHGMRLAEPLFSELPGLVEDLAHSLLPYLDRPFAFFGHSMGALASFELARYLRRHHNLEPVHLFVSGHGAPHLDSPEPSMHTFPEPEFIQKIREMNGTDDGFFNNPELREVFLPILRADFAICGTYQYAPEPPLSCPITAMGGLKDLQVPRADLEAWQMHTAHPLKVRMLPGDHFYLKNNRMAMIEILARELNYPSPRSY